MDPLKNDKELSREALVVLVVEQRETILAQQSQITALTSRAGELTATITEQAALIETLREKVEELERSSKRQAAPFSKGKQVKPPKRSGRKKGQGTFSFRQGPSEEEWTEPPVDVKVEQERCAECGGRLEEERVEIATVTELPEVIRPRVTAYRVSVCRCAQCGKTVRGRHPALAPDQFGATAHRLGPRLKAAGHALHYKVGVLVRKVPEVLDELCGVSVTQSALTQDALKQAATGSEKKAGGGKIGEAYQALRESVKEAPIVNTDDTGWRIGGETAFLMTFDTEIATVYQIRRRHRNEEVRELLPGDYSGVMGCDRGKSYDAKERAAVRQQKCLSHIDRSLVKELEGREGADRRFPETLRTLLFEDMDLWKALRAGAIDRDRYDVAGALLGKEVTLHLLREKLRLLREAPDPEDRSDVDRSIARILDQIGWHHTIGNLLRFLEDPAIEPTNNRAERALRPAVIARNVSHCSKNDRGAQASAAFTSVLQTLKKSGGATVETLASVMLFGHLAPLGLSPPPSA